jgi:hypothetical protein
MLADTYQEHFDRSALGMNPAFWRWGSDWIGVNVATRALTQPQVGPLHPPLRLRETYTGSGMAFPGLAVPAATEESDDLYVSHSDALGGARGAIMAIGIEITAAVCIYGIWQLWHIFR